MAVGLERAHAQLLGQGEGLALVGFGSLNLRGLALRGDLAKEVEGPCCAVGHLMGEGMLEGVFALGEESRLIRSSPTLHRPMRHAEDGVGMGEAIRAYLYCTWLPKESRKSWGT